MSQADGDIDPRLAEILSEKAPSHLATDAIVVAAYIDADGEERWGAYIYGNGRTASTIGLLEYAKSWLLDSMKQET